MLVVVALPLGSRSEITICYSAGLYFWLQTCRVLAANLPSAKSVRKIPVVQLCVLIWNWETGLNPDGLMWRKGFAADAVRLETLHLHSTISHFK